MGVKLKMHLNKDPDVPYRPGQMIDVNILVSNTSKKAVPIKTLLVTFIGCETVKWEDQDCPIPICIPTPIGIFAISTSTKYKDGVCHVAEQYELLDEGLVEPGSFELHFLVQLPLGVPSSFKSKDVDARVMYTISAALKTSSAFTSNVKDEVDISVLGFAEIPALYLQIASPLSVVEIQPKRGKCLRVELPNKIWIPGDFIPFKIIASKPKSFSWSPSVQLVKEIRLRVRTGETSNASKKIITTVVGKKNGAGQEKSMTKFWEGCLQIPDDDDVPPTDLGGSNHIIVKYLLKVTGTGIDDIKVPIFINSTSYEIMVEVAAADGTQDREEDLSIPPFSVAQCH